MKELEPHNVSIPEIIAEANQKQEYTHIASELIKRGMYYWYLDTETMEAKKIETESHLVFHSPEEETTIIHRANLDHKTLYVKAINKRNAERKLLNIINRFDIG